MITVICTILKRGVQIEQTCKQVMTCHKTGFIGVIQNWGWVVGAKCPPQTFQLCATLTSSLAVSSKMNNFQLHPYDGSQYTKWKFFNGVSFLHSLVKYEKHQLVTYTHKHSLLRTVNHSTMPGFFCLAPKPPMICTSKNVVSL